MIKKIKNIYKIFGPGILMATAAIGGSHLVSSTQAGALFGWSLAIFILLSHLQIAINNPQFKLNQIQKKPFEIV